MKKQFAVVVMLSFIFLQVSAQQDLYKWKVRAYSGLAHYYNANYEADDYRTTDNNILYRLELAGNISKSFGVSLSSTFGNIKGIDFFGNVFSTESKMASFRLYYFTDNDYLLASSSILSPYVYTGIGLTDQETRYGLSTVKSSTYPAFPAGLGLKLRLFERITLDVQGEFVYSPDQHLRNPIPLFSSSTNSYFNAGVALSYNFVFRKSDYKAPRFYAGEIALLEKQKILVPSISYELLDSIILNGDTTLIIRKSKNRELRIEGAGTPSDSLTKRTMDIKRMVSLGRDSVMEVEVELDTFFLAYPDSIVSWREDTALEFYDHSGEEQLQDDSVEMGVSKYKDSKGRDSVVVKRTIVRSHSTIDTLSINKMKKDSLISGKYIQRESKQKNNGQKPKSKRLYFDPDDFPQEDEAGEPDEYDDVHGTRYSRSTEGGRWEQETERNIPTEISAGYIVGVRPNDPAGVSDTIPWQDIQRYLEELSAQNQMLLSKIDRGDYDSESTMRSAQISDTTSLAEDSVQHIRYNEILKFMKQQAAFNDSLMKKLSEKEKSTEMNQMAPVSGTIDTLIVAHEGIQVLSDSLEAIKKLLKGKKETDKLKDIDSITVYFKTNSNTVPVESIDDLNAVAKILISNKTWMVEIHGHSDRSGRASYNLVLSKKRADTVGMYLRKRGVSAAQLIIKYFGEKFAEESANPLDRKVIVKIVKK